MLMVKETMLAPEQVTADVVYCPAKFVVYWGKSEGLKLPEDVARTRTFGTGLPKKSDTFPVMEEGVAQLVPAEVESEIDAMGSMLGSVLTRA